MLKLPTLRKPAPPPVRAVDEWALKDSTLAIISQHYGEDVAKELDLEWTTDLQMREAGLAPKRAKEARMPSNSYHDYSAQDKKQARTVGSKTFAANDPTGLAKALAAEKGISFLEALNLPAVQEAYTAFKDDLAKVQQSSAGPPRPLVLPSRFDEDGADAYSDRGAMLELKAIEKQMNDLCASRCRAKGELATPENIARAMTEVLTENPTLYTSYVELQRRAAV
jgi:hypothetical protein